MRYLAPQTIHPRIEYLGRQEMCVYLLKGKEYMIIEGGMSYIVPSILRQFQERKIDSSRITRLLLLHSHFDHCGIVPFFKRKIPRLKVVGSRRSQELYRKEKVVNFIRDRNREMIHLLKMEKEAAKLNLDFDQIAVDEAVAEGDVIDLEEAKVQVGHRVLLLGNIRPAAVMYLGKQDNVRANARECLAKAWNTPKGFILGLGCGLPINTPPENIHALVEAAREFGRWPLDPDRFALNEAA